MLTPIPEKATHYGLTWTGHFDTERYADSWETRHGDYQYLILDLGYVTLLMVTNTRLSKEVGHRAASMKRAALMASEHAKALYF